MLRMPLTHIQRQKLNSLQWGYQVQEVESSGLSHTVVVFDLLFCSFIFFFFFFFWSIPICPPQRRSSPSENGLKIFIEPTAILLGKMKFFIYGIAFMSMVRLSLPFLCWNLTLELFARFRILVKMASNTMWCVEPRIVKLLVDSYFQWEP